uniref:Uncharacterized protein n=1 Tax=Octopus bimaculoides TaxID=37653 RepID=A0A0L8H9U3_OCTBM
MVVGYNHKLHNFPSAQHKSEVSYLCKTKYYYYYYDKRLFPLLFLFSFHLPCLIKLKLSSPFCIYAYVYVCVYAVLFHIYKGGKK